MLEHCVPLSVMHGRKPYPIYPACRCGMERLSFRYRLHSCEDAQYVALAQSLNAPLITEDRKLGEAVPEIAFSLREFLAR